MEPKRIIEALKKVKETCEEYKDNCESCPLYIEPENTCGLADLSPDNWEINDEEITWRALL